MMRAALLAALVTAVLAGCGTRTTAGADDARLIVVQFLAARQARNLEATMECFVDQPEIHNSQGVGWTGREAVRAIITFRLRDSYSVGDLHVSGNRVSWMEHVTRAPDGTRQITGAAGSGPSAFDQEVEALVVGGRIASLATYTNGARPTARGAQDVTSNPPADLLVPLGVLVLVATAVLIWPSADRMRPSAARSGHLMSGLQEYVARRG